MEKLAEKLQAPTGRLVLDIFRDGALIEHWDVENLIVDGSKALLSSLLGGTTANKFITRIGFGTSGAPALASNTALTGAFLKNVNSVAYPVAGQVQFSFSLSSSEGNGMAIIEFGLLTADATLFSRRVRSSAINKDNTLSFSGTWTIIF